MLKLVLDTKSEIYPYLKGIADEIFYDLSKVKIRQSAVYILGKSQVDKHTQLVHDLVSKKIKIVIAVPTEGGETILPHCQKWKLLDAIRQKQVLLLTGAPLDQNIPNFSFEWFLPKVFDYPENQIVFENFEKIFANITKPYFCLFLNGRFRLHRYYLLHKFTELNLLNDFLYSNLDVKNGPIKYLPNQYEFFKFRSTQTKFDNFVKGNLFQNTWGEIYIEPHCYIDTYLSVITETSFELPFSFRTEKIAKPLAAGHPFLVVANEGYYRDLQNLGFKTFSGIIDEKFDLISDNQLRMDRILSIILEIKQDPVSFMLASKDICQYNQMFLYEMSPKFNSNFVVQFTNFVKENFYA